jgi:quercetin dioxygenase-like cupin family protein
MSAFADVSTITAQRIRDGVRGRSVHGERVTLALIELEPDAVVPEHAHDNEQVGLLLEGSIRFRIGDETRVLGRGETWCIPSHTPHDVAAGPDGAVLVEVFAPPRADWHALADAPGASRWP